MRVRRTIFVVLLLTLMATASIAAPTEHYHSHHMWGEGWTGWLLSPLAMILAATLTVAIVVGVAKWLRYPSETDAGASRHSTAAAVSILRERYARGEIDDDEYQERKRVLTS